MPRFVILLCSLIAATFFTNVEGYLSSSRLLGYDTTPHDGKKEQIDDLYLTSFMCPFISSFVNINTKALLLHELGSAISDTTEQCANDIELFCSPERGIFLAFGNGISTFTATATVFHSIEDEPTILLAVFSYGNRRLQAQNSDIAYELDDYMHLLKDYYPRPIYGFGEEKDKCLQTILRGVNPTDFNYPPPPLSQKCAIAARTVNNRYMEINKTVEENDFYEFVSFTAISAIAFLSVITSFLTLEFFSSSERINVSESNFCSDFLSGLKHCCLGIAVLFLLVVLPKLYFVIIPCFLSTLCLNNFFSVSEDDDEVCAYDYVELNDQEEEGEELVFIGVPIRIV